MPSVKSQPKPQAGSGAGGDAIITFTELRFAQTLRNAMARVNVAVHTEADHVPIGPNIRVSKPDRKVFVVGLYKTRGLLEEQLRLARKSNRAGFPKAEELMTHKGITQIDHTLFVDPRETIKGTLSKLHAFSTSFITQTDINRMNSERIAVMKILNELGYRVITPNYGNNGDINIERARRYARTFNATLPIIMRDYNPTLSLTSVGWPRDMWQRFGDVRIRRFGIVQNRLGEGGKSVPINASATLTSQDLAGSGERRQLSRYGHRFYFLEPGFQSWPLLSRAFGMDAYVGSNHVDIFVGVVGKVLLVERDYFVGKNKSVLGRAAEDHHLKILFVPPGESRFYPANFLRLEDDTALVDSRAQETISLLRKNRVTVVPTPLPMMANMDIGGGGVRCFTNEL